jgi:hypothetical protein
MRKHCRTEKMWQIARDGNLVLGTRRGEKPRRRKATTSSVSFSTSNGVIWSEVHQVLSIIFRPHSLFWNTKFCEELIAYFPFIRHGPHRKRRFQEFFFRCVCIRCRGNVFTEPLRSNGKGVCLQTHRLMRGIYEVRRWDGPRCRDIHTRFHKDLARHSIHRPTTCWSHKPTFVFFFF